MSTITVRRLDVTSEEITQALRLGLGPRYNVLPGMRMTRVPFSSLQPGEPDLIVVAIGSNRLWRVQLTITRQAGATQIRISPGGLTLSAILLNIFGVGRKVRRVLLSEPSLSDDT